MGITGDQLEALVRDRAREKTEILEKYSARLERDLDLNQRQVRAALDILGEKDIPPERLAAKLVEIAERFKELQATAAVQPGDDPKVAVLKTEAQNAIVQAISPEPMKCLLRWSGSRPPPSTVWP